MQQAKDLSRPLGLQEERILEIARKMKIDNVDSELVVAVTRNNLQYFMQILKNHSYGADIIVKNEIEKLCENVNNLCAARLAMAPNRNNEKPPTRKKNKEIIPLTAQEKNTLVKRLIIQFLYTKDAKLLLEEIHLAMPVEGDYKVARPQEIRDLIETMKTEIVESLDPKINCMTGTERADSIKKLCKRVLQEHVERSLAHDAPPVASEVRVHTEQ